MSAAGTVSIKAGYNKADFRPIEDGCDCFACRHFTRAYLRHLLNVDEILGLRMLSVHNSHMYLKLMADIRAHIAAGTFGAFIKILSPLPSRRATFDIGVAGPIAGFIALIPVLIIGLLTIEQVISPEQVADAQVGLYFSNPLLTQFLAWLFGVDATLSLA